MSSFLSLTHDSMQGRQSNETRQQISLCLLLKNSAQLGPTFSATAHYIKTIVIKYKVEMPLTQDSSPTFSPHIEVGWCHLYPLRQWSGSYFYHRPAHVIMSWMPASRWYPGRKPSITKIAPYVWKIKYDFLIWGFRKTRKTRRIITKRCVLISVYPNSEQNYSHYT